MIWGRCHHVISVKLCVHQTNADTLRVIHDIRSHYPLVSILTFDSTFVYLQFVTY